MTLAAPQAVKSPDRPTAAEVKLAGIVVEQLFVDGTKVTTAVTSAGLPKIQVARLVTRLVRSPKWPGEPLGGRAADALCKSLYEAGVLGELPTCARCKRTILLEYETELGWLCRSCNSTVTRDRTRRVLCPSGHLRSVNSSHCPACQDDEARRAISGATAAFGVDQEAIEESIAGMSRLNLRRVGHWLSEGHSLVDVDAPGSVQAIQRYLRDAGLEFRTDCAACGRDRLLRHRVDGKKVCNTCYQGRRTADCIRCGKDRPVAWRDFEGNPWCQVCRQSHEDTHEACSECGRVGRVTVRGPEGPVGDCCYQLPVEPCVECGRHAPVWGRRPDGPRCRRCFANHRGPCGRCGRECDLRSRGAGHRRWCDDCLGFPAPPPQPCEPGEVARDEHYAALRKLDEARAASVRISDLGPSECVGCREPRKIHGYFPDGPRCSACYEKALRHKDVCTGCLEWRRVFSYPPLCEDCFGGQIGHRCKSCGLEDRLYADGCCARCVLLGNLGQLPEENPSTPGVVAVLMSLGDPKSTMQWWRKAAAAEIVRGVLQKPSKSTHEDLDNIQRPPTRKGNAHPRHDVEFARAILVAGGAIEPRDDILARYNAWVLRRLAGWSPASERLLLLRFHRERLKPTVERKSSKERPTVGTIRWAQARLRVAQSFLLWVRSRGGIEGFNKATLHRWYAGPTTRHLARDFFIWLIDDGQLRLARREIPRRDVIGVSPMAGYDEREIIAQALLYDPGYGPELRVAGLLVVLYGQHLSRIVSLRNTDVRRASAQVRLGRSWLDIPEPMDQHLRMLVDSIEEAVASKEPTRPTFLFPGIRPGQHLSADTLGIRLNAVGIRALPHRNAAIFGISAAVEPRVLSDLLGMSIGTASKWVNLAGGAYSNYWDAIVLEQQQDDAVDDEDGDIVDVGASVEPEEGVDLLLELGLIDPVADDDDDAGGDGWH